MTAKQNRSAIVLGVTTGLLITAVLIFFYLPSQASSPDLLPGISMDAEAGYLIHSEPLAPKEFLHAASLSEEVPAEGQVVFRSDRSEGENIYLLIDPKKAAALKPYENRVFLSLDNQIVSLKDFIDNPPVFFLESGDSKTVFLKALLDSEENLPIETVDITLKPTPESLLPEEVKK